jgi:uncharacterized protein (DUF1499 family)
MNAGSNEDAREIVHVDATAAPAHVRKVAIGMRPPPPLGPSFYARWTSRIALFSVGLLVTAMALHRLLALPTPVALNLAGVAFVGAGLSLLFAFAAAIGVWRTGRPGTSRIVFGTLVSLGLLLWPLIYLPRYEALPEINDVTTDPLRPPAFVALAKERGASANSIEYPGAAFAEAQAAAYPDIKPIAINRSADEAFELAADAIRRLKMDIVRQKGPDPETGRPGTLEVVDRTLVLGFYDDVAIRVTGNEEEARIDVRSASRYGSHDLGRNADRIRQILKEIVVRLESVVPAARAKSVTKKKEVKEERPRSRRSRRRRRR